MARRSSGGDAAVIFAVLGFAVLAVVGVYLLAAGLVAALGVAAAWVIRQAKNHAARQAMVKRAEPPPPPPAPLERHEALVEVPREVFDDLVTTEVEAIKVFSAWVRRHPNPPPDPAALVHASELQTRLVARLHTVLERRSFEWRERAQAGLSKPTRAPAVSQRMLWEASEEELRLKTDHMAECDGCSGAGQLACPTCKGATSVVCPGCNGARKRYDTARNGSRRLMNCTACGAKGQLPCSDCRSGTVECGRCEGHGRVRRWAVMTAARRSDVQVEPDGDVTSAFSWGKDGVEASEEEIGRDAHIVERLQGNPAVDLESVRAMFGAAWCDAHWEALQPNQAPDEKPLFQTLLHLELPAVEVGWSLNDGPLQSTTFEGLRLLAPPPSATAVFERRQRVRMRAAAALAFVPVIALAAYLVRGSYFLTVEVAAVGGLVAIMAGLLFVAYARSFDGRARASLFAALAVIPGLLAAALALDVEPTPSDVEQAIAAHDLGAAERALSVIRGEDEETLAALRRRISLEKVFLTKTSNDALKLVTQHLPQPSAERGLAVKHLDALLMEEAKTAVASRDPARALSNLQLLSAPTPESQALRAAAHEATVDMRLAAKDYRGARETALVAADPAIQERVEADIVAAVNAARAGLISATKAAAQPRERLASVQHLIQMLALTESTPQTKAEAQKLVKQSLSLSQEITIKEEREQNQLARQQAEYQARVERKDKARQAREERERQRSYSRGVRCCDGTYSPTCMTVHRGCCSRHGGVCGG